MPPRRSTRSARSSVEPAPDPTPAPSLPSKRKRGQPSEPSSDAPVTESSGLSSSKPPSRSSARRASGSGSATTARKTSGRGKPVLDEVPETDEEGANEEDGEVDEPSGRARKKARPSHDDDRDEEEEEARTGSGRVKRGSSSKPASKTTRRKAAEKEEEEEEDVAPKKPTRLKTRRAPSVKQEVEEELPKRGGSRRASAQPIKPQQRDEEEDDDDEEEEEPAPPSRTSRRSSAPAHRASSARASSKPAKVEMSVVDIDQVSDSGEEENEPQPRSKVAGKRKASKDDEEDDEDDDNDDDEEDYEESKPSRRSRRSSATPTSKSRPAKPSPKSKPTSTSTSKPSSTRKTSSTSKSKSKSKLPEVAEESEDEVANATKASTAPQSEVETEEDNDDDDDDDIPTESPRKSKTSSARVKPGSQQQTQQQDEEEEEPQSLLGPRPPRRPTVKPVPSMILEEPRDEGPKYRLVIHKMALINFKSYAGRQEIGPFHKSFSAIVGPNGSGKSNTIDALLFVFGYRATKMRQGKLSELIHNSARYPDLMECSVEVYFQEIMDLPGTDAFEVKPGSGLKVARHAFKNNSSKYTIDGQQSSYSDVQKLLKGKGIDLDHNRFLILQGEVESIAQMKPKGTETDPEGLLEYLEDIIGTNRFIPPLTTALSAVDALNDLRAEKLNRLRLVEKDKNALEEKKKKAEEYLRMFNDLVRAKSRLYQWYLMGAFEAGRKIDSAVHSLETELQAQREQFKDDVQHLEQLEADYQERQAVYKELDGLADVASKELSSWEKKEVNLEERKKHAGNKLKKASKALQEEEQARNDATRALEDHTDKLQRERDNLEEHEAKLVQEEKALEKIRDSLKDKTQVYHDQIEVKQKELQPWTAKINVKQSEIDNATSERDALAKRAEEIKQACTDAEQELEGLVADLKGKVEEKNELQTSKADLQREKQDATRTLNHLKALTQDLRGKANASRQKVEEARASQQASTSHNKVLDSLTRLRNAGRVEGFHGRLGSLGTIPEKYDVAVTTACGALNNLVVDTVEQGQACIEYLRAQNVGRASFMILSKISTQSLGKINTPEGALRLFDLITPKEPKFAHAFYKALGNTLVADTLEQANRLAFGSGSQRWRVVTLSGQVIDASGTMSGGGNHVSRGGMSAKLQADGVSPQVLRGYEKDNEEAARALDEAMSQLRAAEATMERIGSDEPTINMSLTKLDMAIKNGQSRVQDAQKRVAELKAQSKPDAGDIARIKTLDKEIAKTTTALSQLQQQSASISDAIEALKKKILDIGGSKLLIQQSAVDSLRVHIGISTDEITKAEVGITKAEKDIKKYNATIQSNEEAVEDMKKEVGVFTKDLDKIQGEMAAFRHKVQEAKAAAENEKDQMEQLKAELDEQNEAVQEFKAKEAELKAALETKKRERASNGATIAHWNELHEKLELQDIDDDEEEEEEAEVSGEQNAQKAAGTPEGEGEGDKDKDDEEDDDAMNEDSAVKPDPDAPAKKTEPVREGRTLHTYRPEELRGCKRDVLEGTVQLLDEKVKRANPDLGVLVEYKRRETEYLKRAEDLEKITAERDAEKQVYDDLRKQRLDEFMAGFNMISLKLKELYQMITIGGNAELELVDSMDPFQEGITFSVMPPKKSWKAISNLSGGEKTLSSLALVFALHVFKPTPLYFMDEIDAALDFRNVSIVANYIKDRTKNAQFIIISLRNDMFELSQRLIGIYKTNNATQSITIDNHSLHGSILGYPGTSVNGTASVGGPSVTPAASVGSAAASVATRGGLSTRVGQVTA